MLLPRDELAGAGFLTYLWTDRHYRKTRPYEFKALLVSQKVLSTMYSALLKKRADDTNQWYFSAPP